MPNIQLQCNAPSCTWTTPELPDTMYPNMVTQLENHSRMSHPATTPTVAANAKVDKPRRPLLQLKQGGCTEEDWTFFRHQTAGTRVSPVSLRTSLSIYKNASMLICSSCSMQRWGLPSMP